MNLTKRQFIGATIALVAVLLVLALPISSSGEACGTILAPENDWRPCEGTLRTFRFLFGGLFVAGILVVLYPSPTNRSDGI